MTFLAKVEISAWRVKEQFKDYTAEKYQEARADLSFLKLPETVEELEKWYIHGDIIVDEVEIEMLIKHGFDVQLKRVKGVSSPAMNPHMLGHNLTQISVHNVGLFHVKKVLLLEDCCTDRLQEKLNEGWRIVAVCPPNDTRRPTYIIGHIDGVVS